MTAAYRWTRLKAGPAEVEKVNPHWGEIERSEALVAALASGEVPVRGRLNGSHMPTRVEKLLSDRDAALIVHAGADCIQVFSVGYGGRPVDHMLGNVEFDSAALKRYVVANFLAADADIGKECRKPGPEPRVLNGVVKNILKDLRGGRTPEALMAEKLATLAAEYRASIGTVREARRRAYALFNSSEIVTPKNSEP
jgi:hypothetical protein